MPQRLQRHSACPRLCSPSDMCRVVRVEVRIWMPQQQQQPIYEPGRQPGSASNLRSPFHPPNQTTQGSPRHSQSRCPTHGCCCPDSRRPAAGRRGSRQRRSPRGCAPACVCVRVGRMNQAHVIRQPQPHRSEQQRQRTSESRVEMTAAVCTYVAAAKVSCLTTHARTRSLTLMHITQLSGTRHTDEVWMVAVSAASAASVM
jgi:hypothetical protein